MAPGSTPTAGSAPYAAAEAPVQLVVNGAPAACFHCTPVDLDDLALGWLLGEGVVSDATEIETLSVSRDERTVSVRILSDAPAERLGSGSESGCARWPAAADIAPETVRSVELAERLLFDPGSLRPLFRAMFDRAPLRDAGGGIHTGALVVDGDVQLVMEEVGRHNLVDKLTGRAVRDGLPLTQALVMLSARISGAIALKLWRTGVPAVATISVPTTMACGIAARCGITMVGRALKQNPHLYPVPG